MDFAPPTRDTGSMIEVKNLTVICGKTEILHSLSFVAEAGYLTTIVGTNGSGKTTLIKALSGDLSYSGVIKFNGHDIVTKKPSELAIMRAILPQSTNLTFPFLVREVVELGLSASIMSKQARKHLPEMALKKVDLSGYEGRFYQELSGGEQARVQLARVLCQIWQPLIDNQPCWLLLDEPVASLDISHQLIVMDIARNFARSGGGVLTILHDLNLAAHYSDKIILLDRGTLVSEGLPSDVITTPTLRDVYHCNLTVGKLPPESVPFILPQSASLS